MMIGWLRRAWSAVATYARLWGYVARHPVCGARGMWEFRGGVGMTYDDDPWSDRSYAYDAGRELAHRATFRHWDEAHHRDVAFFAALARRARRTTTTTTGTDDEE